MGTVVTNRYQVSTFPTILDVCANHKLSLRASTGTLHTLLNRVNPRFFRYDIIDVYVVSFRSIYSRHAWYGSAVVVIRPYLSGIFRDVIGNFSRTSAESIISEHSI